MPTSKHTYPDSDVLVNKLDITDQSQLDQAERNLSGIRQMELHDSPIADGKFDLKHLQSIHKHLFQDLYHFAGKLRDEQVAKDGFQFASPLFIEDMGKDLFKELKQEDFLKGKDKQELSDRLAYYMSEINVLHPFREGNGRTQREFTRSLAMKNGFTLDWTKISKEDIQQASISSKADPKHLSNVIYEAINEKEASKEVMNEWKKHENDMELE